MEQDFYISKFTESKIDIVVPNVDERLRDHQIIFKELCQGKISVESKKEFLDIVNTMVGNGTEGVILGSTEIGLLIQQEDLAVPVFDTTDLHANALVTFALNDE